MPKIISICKFKPYFYLAILRYSRFPKIYDKKFFENFFFVIKFKFFCYKVKHRGLICKLVRLLLDTHMITMIMEFVPNGSFTPAS